VEGELSWLFQLLHPSLTLILQNVKFKVLEEEKKRLEDANRPTQFINIRFRRF
jgi:hypothetical protein